MNIFVLDTDHQKCAQYHCDKHVVKMILEHAQMLSVANPCDTSYKPTHKNHPCTKWVCESYDNYMWLCWLTYHLNQEWQYRYKHKRNHKAFDVILSLPDPAHLPKRGLTPFAQAMPTQFKVVDDAVSAYRNYYTNSKQDIISYTRRPVPNWLIDIAA